MQSLKQEQEENGQDISLEYLIDTYFNNPEDYFTSDIGVERQN
jgi:hypothetical protein